MRFTVVSNGLSLEDFILVHLEAGVCLIGALIEIRLIIRSEARKMEDIMYAQ